MITITHIALENGVLLATFVYYGLEGGKLPPPCQPIIISRKKVNDPLKGDTHLLTSSDCFIVHAIGGLPTDQERGVSTLWIQGV